MTSVTLHGVVELVDVPNVTLAPHRRRPDLLSGQIRLRPLVVDEVTLLTVTLGNHVAPVRCGSCGNRSPGRAPVQAGQLPANMEQEDGVRGPRLDASPSCS